MDSLVTRIKKYINDQVDKENRSRPDQFKSRSMKFIKRADQEQIIKDQTNEFNKVSRMDYCILRCGGRFIKYQAVGLQVETRTFDGHNI
jgi:hypothetical protein